MENILIVGYGQIGVSLHRVYKLKGGKKKFKVYIHDTTTQTEPIPNKVDIMHICYGYSPSFIDDTVVYIKKHSPLLTIIHSTIPFKTTKTIWSRCTNGVDYANIVHSPVIGRHPNLTEGLLTFVKMVGGYSDKAVNMACSHLVSFGITPVVYNNAAETEAAKLLSTTYYGWNILFMKEVKRYCEERCLDFENVYEATNHLYNEGYTALGLYNVRRPILKYVPGKVGGHCVRPNMELLRDTFYPAKIGIELDDKELECDEDATI